MNLTDVKLRERILYGEQQTEQLNLVTGKLKKIIKLTKQYTQTASTMNSIAQQIASNIGELSMHSYFKIDPKFEECASAIAKLENTHYFMIQQMEFMFEAPMSTILEEELKYSSEVQKVLQQSKNDYDQVRHRYYTAIFEGLKPKDDLSLEMINLQEECSKIYRDYNAKINNALVLSNFDITEKICSYMYLLYNSHCQSIENLGKIQPAVNTMMDQLKSSRTEFSILNSKPDHIDQLICDFVDNRSTFEKQGYLLMRRKNLAWKLVWVTVRYDCLICYKRWKNSEDILTIELTLTSFRMDKSDNLVFKLISPKVEAEFKSTNEIELTSWKIVIENAIKKGLKSADFFHASQPSPNLYNSLYQSTSTHPVNNNNHHSHHSDNNNNISTTTTSSPLLTSLASPSSTSSSSTPQLITTAAVNTNPIINNNFNNNNNNNNNMDALMSRTRLGRVQSQYWNGAIFNDIYNAKCADCDTLNPEWASLNLGIMLCDQCSGIHRSMGVHVSKVKSIFLDHWSIPQLKILELIGNERANAFWEYKITEGTQKPNRFTSPKQKQDYIHQKYLQRLFINPAAIPKDKAINLVKNGDVLSLSRLLCVGGDVNEKFENKPLIHYAITQRDIVLLEYLLSLNIDLNITDSENRTPLDQALAISDEPSINTLRFFGAKTSQELLDVAKKRKLTSESNNNSSNNNNHTTATSPTNIDSPHPKPSISFTPTSTSTKKSPSLVEFKEVVSDEILTSPKRRSTAISKKHRNLGSLEHLPLERVSTPILPRGSSDSGGLGENSNTSGECHSGGRVSSPKTPTTPTTPIGSPPTTEDAFRKFVKENISDKRKKKHRPKSMEFKK